jgi:hypothetical protein
MQCRRNRMIRLAVGETTRYWPVPTMEADGDAGHVIPVAASFMRVRESAGLSDLSSMRSKRSR